MAALSDLCLRARRFRTNMALCFVSFPVLDKTNIGALGNIVQQLRTHVIARRISSESP
jgi:diadenosine tetraphosphate (Ap4A) HIT family hydrolase